MNFSSFANLLKPIIGGSDNTVEFTRKLFIAMIGENNSTVIEDKSDGSTKQKELATKTVKAYLVPLPPFAEQKRIVEKVNQLLQLLK